MITPAMGRPPAAASNSALTDANLERRLGNLERRHDKTRALLVDAVSLAVMGLVGFYYKPEGIHAFLFGFCGALFVPGLLSSWFLRGEDGLRSPMSRFDRTCMYAAITGVLVLAVAVIVFLHPLERLGS